MQAESTATRVRNFLSYANPTEAIVYRMTTDINAMFIATLKGFEASPPAVFLQRLLDEQLLPSLIEMLDVRVDAEGSAFAKFKILALRLYAEIFRSLQNTPEDNFPTPEDYHREVELTGTEISKYFVAMGALRAICDCFTQDACDIDLYTSIFTFLDFHIGTRFGMRSLLLEVYDRQPVIFCIATCSFEDSKCTSFVINLFVRLLSLRLSFSEMETLLSTSLIVKTVAILQNAKLHARQLPHISRSALLLVDILEKLRHYLDEAEVGSIRSNKVVQVYNTWLSLLLNSDVLFSLIEFARQHPAIPGALDLLSTLFRHAGMRRIEILTRMPYSLFETSGVQLMSTAAGTTTISCIPDVSSEASVTTQEAEVSSSELQLIDMFLSTYTLRTFRHLLGILSETFSEFSASSVSSTALSPVNKTMSEQTSYTLSNVLSSESALFSSAPRDSSEMLSEDVCTNSLKVLFAFLAFSPTLLKQEIYNDEATSALLFPFLLRVVSLHADDSNAAIFMACLVLSQFLLLFGHGCDKRRLKALAHDAGIPLSPTLLYTVLKAFEAVGGPTMFASIPLITDVSRQARSGTESLMASSRISSTAATDDNLILSQMAADPLTDHLADMENRLFLSATPILLNAGLKALCRSHSIMTHLRGMREALAVQEFSSYKHDTLLAHVNKALFGMLLYNIDYSVTLLHPQSYGMYVTLVAELLQTKIDSCTAARMDRPQRAQLLSILKGFLADKEIERRVAPNSMYALLPPEDVLKLLRLLRQSPSALSPSTKDFLVRYIVVPHVFQDMSYDGSVVDNLNRRLKKENPTYMLNKCIEDLTHTLCAESKRSMLASLSQSFVSGEEPDIDQLSARSGDKSASQLGGDRTSALDVLSFDIFASSLLLMVGEPFSLVNYDIEEERASAPVASGYSKLLYDHEQSSSALAPPHRRLQAYLGIERASDLRSLATSVSALMAHELVLKSLISFFDGLAPSDSFFLFNLEKATLTGIERDHTRLLVRENEQFMAKNGVILQSPDGGRVVLNHEAAKFRPLGAAVKTFKMVLRFLSTEAARLAAANKELTGPELAALAQQYANTAILQASSQSAGSSHRRRAPTSSSANPYVTPEYHSLLKLLNRLSERFDERLTAQFEQVFIADKLQSDGAAGESLHNPRGTTTSIVRRLLTHKQCCGDDDDTMHAALTLSAPPRRAFFSLGADPPLPVVTAKYSRMPSSRFSQIAVLDVDNTASLPLFSLKLADLLDISALVIRLHAPEGPRVKVPDLLVRSANRHIYADDTAAFSSTDAFVRRHFPEYVHSTLEIAILAARKALKENDRRLQLITKYKSDRRYYKELLRREAAIRVCNTILNSLYDLRLIFFGLLAPKALFAERYAPTDTTVGCSTSSQRSPASAPDDGFFNLFSANGAVECRRSQGAKTTHAPSVGPPEPGPQSPVFSAQNTESSRVAAVALMCLYFNLNRSADKHVLALNGNASPRSHSLTDIFEDPSSTPGCLASGFNMLDISASEVVAFTSVLKESLRYGILLADGSNYLTADAIFESIFLGNDSGCGRLLLAADDPAVQVFLHTNPEYAFAIPCTTRVPITDRQGVVVRNDIAAKFRVTTRATDKPCPRNNDVPKSRMLEHLTETVSIDGHTLKIYTVDVDSALKEVSPGTVIEVDLNPQEIHEAAQRSLESALPEPRLCEIEAFPPPSPLNCPLELTVIRQSNDVTVSPVGQVKDPPTTPQEEGEHHPCTLTHRHTIVKSSSPRGASALRSVNVSHLDSGEAVPGAPDSNDSPFQNFSRCNSELVCSVPLASTLRDNPPLESEISCSVPGELDLMMRKLDTVKSSNGEPDGDNVLSLRNNTPELYISSSSFEHSPIRTVHSNDSQHSGIEDTDKYNIIPTTNPQLPTTSTQAQARDVPCVFSAESMLRADNIMNEPLDIVLDANDIKNEQNILKNADVKAVILQNQSEHLTMKLMRSRPQSDTEDTQPLMPEPVNPPTPQPVAPSEAPTEEPIEAPLVAPLPPAALPSSTIVDTSSVSGPPLLSEPPPDFNVVRLPPRRAHHGKR